MKIVDIRKMTTAELTKESAKLKDTIADQKRRFALGELNDVRTVRKSKKDLARMLTVLGEKINKEVS